LIHIKNAQPIASFFWPDFIEVNGCVFVASELPDASSGSDGSEEHEIEPSGQTDSEAEWFVNHIHVLDRFKHNASVVDEEDRFWNQDHPDFRRACALGKQIARMWAYKLLVEFPSYDFLVCYTQNDNPIVRFQRVRSNEYDWLDNFQKEIAAGEIVVYKTAELKNRMDSV